MRKSVFLFANHEILQKGARRLHEEMAGATGDFGKVAGYETKTQKSTILLIYINNAIVEKKTYKIKTIHNCFKNKYL